MVGGYLRALYLQYTAPTGKMTPKQRRRYQKKQRRREKFAYRHDAPWGVIQQVELENT